MKTRTLLTILFGLSFVFCSSASYGLSQQLLARAPHDECFAGIGKPYPAMVNGTCPSGSTPKADQAYVWGQTKSGTKVWFGTAANVLCLVMGAAFTTTPFVEPTYVCEFGSCSTKPPFLPASVGDWRMPRIYYYDTATAQLVDKTPDKLTQTAAYTLLSGTTGLRSAGTAGGVIFLAGPGLLPSINMFAFDASTGALLDFKSFTAYNDVREWIVANNGLYVGVGTTTGGAVLKWTGSKSNLWSFDVVGNIPQEASNLAFHENRIFVSTWPNVPGNFGLYMSPVLGANGLTTADAAHWTKVWDISQYEPDQIVASVQAGGALRSFGGYLFWGTMMVPMTGAIAAVNAKLNIDANGNGKIDISEVINLMTGTSRAISIFRGKNFGTAAQQIDLAYGDANLHKYDPTQRAYVSTPNAMGKAPLFGASGFGWPFNTYTWSMREYNNTLFIGTFDWSYVLANGGDQLLASVFAGVLGNTSLTSQIAQAMHTVFGITTSWEWGADLFMLVNSSIPGFPYSINGLGNNLNYGIRTLVSDDTGLYVGTANPINLAPLGGWELYRIRK